ncbi:MAG: cellulase family glycosylhydrolase [Thermoleophilia bacterium]|nr:cellulase family glycosylhydrolase [Thermoleophilia bacterium]
MTHPRNFRSLLSIAVLLGSVAAMLVAPAGASAIMVGMESTHELVNTTQSNEQREHALDLMKEQGVQVVRANWRWYEVAAGCGGQSTTALSDPDNACYDWSRLDNLVESATDRKMQVLLSIQQNPEWANHSATNRYYMGGTQTQFNFVKAHFAAFYGAAAKRYNGYNGHGLVRYWTVHNEPNSKVYWGSTPNPARYAQLYGATARAIKAVNTRALIAPGPTGPTGGRGGMQPVLFIKAFQRNVTKYLPGSMANKRRFINAWAHNPYPNFQKQPSFYDPRRQNRNSITMGTIDKLFQTLDASPITRRTKVWATEFGWETRPERVTYTTSARQAQFIAEAFDWLDSKRLGRIGRVQIGVQYGLSDPETLTGDWQSGTLLNNGVTKKPSFFMFQRMISVPQAGLSGLVRANTKLRVWGRSNVNPSGTQLAYRILGQKCRSNAAVGAYCQLRGQRAVIGTPGAKYGYLMVRRGQRIDFRVYDTVSKSYGPPRRVTVR